MFKKKKRSKIGVSFEYPAVETYSLSFRFRKINPVFHVLLKKKSKIGVLFEYPVRETYSLSFQIRIINPVFTVVFKIK